MPHHSVSPLLRERARGLRRDMTDAERKLWLALRAGRLDGLGFRRQVPMGRYIVDFYCAERKLVVELDGGQHSNGEYDARRDAWMSRPSAATWKLRP